MRSSTALVENSNLITKTVFPSEILPVTVFLSSLLNHLLALGLMMAVIGELDARIEPDGADAAGLYGATGLVRRRGWMDCLQPAGLSCATPRRC